MNLPEMLLRLGVALVAWMVVFTHLIWLATLRVTGCESGSDEFWRLLLGFAPFTVVFSLLLTASRKVTAVHGILRWFAVPMALLLPLAIPPIYEAWVATRTGSGSLCGAPAAWHAWWPYVQIFTLTAVCVGLWRGFRRAL